MSKCVTAFFLTMIFSISANACEIDFNASNTQVLKIVTNKKTKLKNYDSICRKLESANASLVVDGAASVLGQRSVAWANIYIKDKNSMIFTNSFSVSAIKVNSYASIKKAEELLLIAIDDAVSSYDLDKSIPELNKARKQLNLISK